MREGWTDIEAWGGLKVKPNKDDINDSGTLVIEGWRD